MRMIGVQLLVLCVLLRSGSALGCDRDPFFDPHQALDPDFLDVTRLRTHNESDPESCWAACCADPDCDLSLVGLPADGGPRCLLVTCGSGACAMKPSDQFTVYRKKVETRAGEDRHIVPLLDLRGPGTNETGDTGSIHCRLPVKVGSCRAAFPRFFYNVTDQRCDRFIYGGCESNGNNFKSEEECEAACSGVTGSVLPVDSTPPPLSQLPVKVPRMAPAAPAEPSSSASLQRTERCEAEPQVGPCRASLKHWYYNKETGSCQSFIYGGCRGNKNNYYSKESCMATCAVTVQPSRKKASDEDEVSSEYKAQCMVTPDPGTCRDTYPMYYYEPGTDTCQSFMYSGCDGNKNQYSTEVECMSRCSRDGRFDHHGKTRNRWTAAVFLFVTLAAVSAVLLAALVIVTLRRHRLSRRPPSVSDKEELLPEPDDRSSLDSLPVPESPKSQEKA
ncbi:kunitz-type protease inhibitor 2 [Embiotoca jacksoni]|uniref:kunitz-type protease inhibitor 2 n=1 Tax=Embiotoca jacksoni TaxID=100190 RepID=UPI003703E817